MSNSQTTAIKAKNGVSNDKLRIPFSNFIKLLICICFSLRIKCANRVLKKSGPAIAVIEDKIKKSTGKKEGAFNLLKSESGNILEAPNIKKRAMDREISFK